MRRPAEGILWTAAQATAADRYTIDELAMPSAVLMERAALCVSAEVERLLAKTPAKQVLVLCGPGNNGGDGLAVARQLHCRGRKVRAVLVCEHHNAAVADQLVLARSHGVTVFDVLPPRLRERSLVVDAMLGTGSSGPARGEVLEAIQWLRGGDDPPIIAVDLPSGIAVDSGAVPGEAIRAHVTVTFQHSKPGLHLTPARAYVGEIVVADIGLRQRPPESGAIAAGAWLISPRAVAKTLAELPEASHKGVRGHVGVIGGSAGTAGAAILAGVAALRAGAGLVTLGVIDPAIGPWLARHPELMSALGPDASRIPGADVLILGPGLSDPAQREHLVALDRDDPRPMVWDAGALDEFERGRHVGPRVLTPHPGEAARLLGRLDPTCEEPWTSARVQTDRVRACRRLVALTGAIVVLKGAGTLVASGQSLAVCTAGSSSLAVAGSGDVLTGAIAALLARGLDPFEAACAGVYLHALAGERSVEGTLAPEIGNALVGALAAAKSVEMPWRWPTRVNG